LRRRSSTVLAGRSGAVPSKRTSGGDAAARAKAVRPSLTTSTAHPSDSSAERYRSPSVVSGSATRTLRANRVRAFLDFEPWLAWTWVLRSGGLCRRSFIAHFRAQPGSSSLRTRRPGPGRRSAASRRCG
jgi:hypothetical protein